MTASRCPYCHAETRQTESVDCPTCRVRHHVECWEENSGCAVQLCESGPELPYLAPGQGNQEPGVQTPARPPLAVERSSTIVGLPETTAPEVTSIAPADRPGAKRSREGRRRRSIGPLALAGAAAVTLAIVLVAFGGGYSRDDPLSVLPRAEVSARGPVAGGEAVPPAELAAETDRRLNDQRALVRRSRKRLERRQQLQTDAERKARTPAPPGPTPTPRSTPTPPAQTPVTPAPAPAAPRRPQPAPKAPAPKPRFGPRTKQSF